jgi:hypothetical protein
MSVKFPVLFFAVFVFSVSLVGLFTDARSAERSNPFIPPNNEDLPNPPANPPPDTDEQDEKDGLLIVLQCKGSSDSFMTDRSGYHQFRTDETANYKINLRNHVVKTLDRGRVYLFAKIDDEEISFKYDDGVGKFSNIITISRRDGTYKATYFVKHDDTTAVISVSGSCANYTNQRKF